MQSLSDLTPDEQLALVGLVVHLVDADGQASTEEMIEFREVAVEMGRKEFDAAFRTAKQRFNSKEDAIAFARSVERPWARELILTVLHDLAQADGISDEERALIDAVGGHWGLRTITK
jgi:uncharacterized tellurite resistance protein B-like protein